MGSKIAQAGESIIMIYRLVLIGIIALVVFGLFQMTYTYHIDVKTSEAKILSRGVAKCLFSGGVLDLEKISEGERKEILNYCGYSFADTKRFYVNLRAFNVNGEEIARFYQGDSGKGWVKKLFDTFVAKGEQKKRIPGRITKEYKAHMLNEGEKFEGTLLMEVLVNDD